MSQATLEKSGVRKEHITTKYCMAVEEKIEQRLPEHPFDARTILIGMADSNNLHVQVLPHALVAAKT